MQRTVFPGINIKGCFFSLYSMYLVKRTETWFTDSLQRKRRQPPASSKDCSLTTTSAQHDRGLLVQRTRRHRRHRHQHCNSLLHSLRYWVYRRQPNHYTRGTQNYKPSRRLARQTQETSESSASEHLQHNTVTQTWRSHQRMQTDSVPNRGETCGEEEEVQRYRQQTSNTEDQTPRGWTHTSPIRRCSITPTPQTKNFKCYTIFVLTLFIYDW